MVQQENNLKDYRYYNDIGILDIQNGRLESAIEKLTKSIEMRKDWEISYFYRAVANQALENFDEAVLDYTKALQINTKMCDAYYNRAKITLSRKDIDNPNLSKAIEDLTMALELDENFVDALFAMAAAYKKLGDYNLSLEYLDKLLKIEPDAINAKALKKLLLSKYIK